MNQHLTAILGELRHQLESLYKHQLAQIVLFGSQARGDASPDSDIDVLIVLKEAFNYSDEIERISFIIAPLCLKYSILVSCAFVTLEQFQHRNNAFLRNIRQEGIAV